MAFQSFTHSHPSFLVVDFLLQTPVPLADRADFAGFALDMLVGPEPFAPIGIFLNLAPDNHVLFVVPLTAAPAPGSPDVAVTFTYQLNRIPA